MVLKGTLEIVLYRVTHPSCHPKISLCAGIQKTSKMLNWQPSEMTKPTTCHPPKKLQSPELAPAKLARVGDSAIFWWWQVLEYVISEGSQFRTLLF